MLQPDDLTFDEQHLWHPYTSFDSPLPVYPVKSASGVMLELADGRQLVDGMASWWSAVHGYQVPELDRAAQQQLEQMSHVMFGGLTHEPAIRLAEQLVALTPPELDAVFLADSGSVSVEVALKMAIQYQYSLGRYQQRRFGTVRGGYHGDTFAAMSVCDPVNGMHELFRGVVSEHLFAPVPQCAPDQPFEPNELAPVRALFEQHGHEMAAFILEPLVQGAGGMNFYHPDYLAGVRQLCTDYGVLLIADEIATGFGRTGTLFACEQAQVTPDIMCLGKALTGGYLTLGATIARREVAATISQGPGGGNLMHGPTFMGNPLACAIASEAIQLLQRSPWQQRVQAIARQLKTELAPARHSPLVADVRTFGAIGVIEMQAPFDMARAQPAIVDQGVWIRPFGRLLYIMPPYIITAAELRQLTEAMLNISQRDDLLLSLGASKVT